MTNSPPSKVMIDAARQLRLYMRRVGVTQHELAKRIGHTEKHISRVLTGKAGASDLDDWARAVGATFVVSLVMLNEESEPT